MHASGIHCAGRRVWLGLAVAIAALLAAGTLRAQETELTIGDWYRVGVQRGGLARSYQGTLIKVTDKWLVLNAVTQETTNQGVRYLRDLPGAGKWFSRPTTVRADSDCWIPRDAASIQAHRPASDDADVKSLDAAEPPIRRAYTIEVIDKGELVERQRDLLKVRNDILLFGPPNASPMAREVVDRRDVVSLRSTRFEKVAEK